MQQHNYLPLQRTQVAMLAEPARVAQNFSADFVLMSSPSTSRVATSHASLTGSGSKSLLQLRTSIPVTTLDQV